MYIHKLYLTYELFHTYIPCAEQQIVCEQQQDEITNLRQQLESLHRLKLNQRQKHRQQLHESEVEKQQEAYLQRMMADVGKKSQKKFK